MFQQSISTILCFLLPLWAIRRCDGLATPKPPKFVFLTGATGFVGSHVARDILKCDPTASVVCLVRSKDPMEAQARLDETFNKYDLGEYNPGRLLAIPGDVVQPNFGLSDYDFDFWASKADSVVHCAADIGLAKDSEANGSKTIDNVLDFAAGGDRASSLHFVSSIAAVGLADTDTILEDGEYPVSASFPGGYGEAKHAAEARIKSWASENSDKPSYIYRAPFITGKVSQQHTVPDIFFKLVCTLGVLPQPRKYLPLCTINHLSKIMAHSIVYGDEVLESGKVKHEKGVPKVLHTVAEQQTWNEQNELIRQALPIYTDAEEPFLPELSRLAKEERGKLICRSSKKACSPIAVGMLGSVLEQNAPFFDAKSTWEFLSECMLDRSVAKMTTHDIHEAFDAATEKLNIVGKEPFVFPEFPPALSLSRNMTMASA